MLPERIIYGTEVPRAVLITFLALARGSICRVEHAYISLSVTCTKLTERLTWKLLVKVAKIVTADATKLPLLVLEIACAEKHTHTADTTAARPWRQVTISEQHEMSHAHR